ncbi:filamentation induced by cAMP protein Fic [uncultured Candidatus Thioglobus sp.]|nr:filamentation induced by cAMP protein Fic [uncultured Candidatus Thioglobus sp.]
MKARLEKILSFVDKNPGLSSSAMHKSIGFDVELITVKRYLSSLISQKLLLTKGKGRATKYFVTPFYKLNHPVDIIRYFENETDDRDINATFNLDLIDKTLVETNIFSVEELAHLSQLQNKYSANISQLPDSIYKQELERLGIDLSWKSSQIEGNTYSLLETELLLKEQTQAKGKSQEEASMLLNHKIALDYIIDNPTYFKEMNLQKIEEMHSLLVLDLGIEKNIRKRLVGITGTNYTPLDNEHQIKEAIHNACALVNTKENIFEKSLLILILLSYIQAFADGNKRTARMSSNAILVANNYCPISFRSVDSLDYKKAMLIFYEQNNLYAFKQIYIEQYEFAVNHYFR